MELSGYAFGRVCDIEPDRTDGGVIDISVPQSEYARRDEKAVHDYGWGPFCSFGVPDDGTHCPGVYVIAVGDDVAYVGETKDLYEQFANGYGQISPANCFEGGQGTNCRLNTAIFHAVRAGDRVSLHLHATDDFGGTESENRALRRIIKDDLVSALDPAWNKATGSEADEEDGRLGDDGRDDAGRDEEDAPAGDVQTRAGAAESGRYGAIEADPSGRSGASGADEFVAASPEPSRDRRPDARRIEPTPDELAGQFAELYDYLTEHERDRIERSFAELEIVLDAHLPTEARRWQRWWANDAETHPHSRSWLGAGFEVTDVSLPEGRVVFERVAEKRSPAEPPTPRSTEAPSAGRASPRRRE